MEKIRNSNDTKILNINGNKKKKQPDEYPVYLLIENKREGNTRGSINAF